MLTCGTSTTADLLSEVNKSTQYREAIIALYKAQGYNDVFFFEDGFTYTESNDVGIYEDGTAWIYNGSLPKVVSAGLTPSEPTFSLINTNDIPTEYDLFIIYGQSNAVGFAGGTEGRKSIPEHAYFWYNRGASLEWRPLEYNMPFVDGVLTTTSTGHAYIEFAREYTKRTGRGCLFIPAAYGGLSITELSQPSIHWDALTNAIAEVQADTTYNIRATRMLWHQGESDMTDGTTRSEYLSLFVTLWNNIKGLVGASHCYIAKVGNPQSRPEPNRYAIQVAQDYLAYNVSDISMAFDGCGSFIAADGMLQPLPDATHYTQKGYNLMGLEMAKVVADREVTETASSSESNNLKGFISTPADQAHRAVGATLIHDGTDFVLKSISDGGRYRSSFVQSLDVSNGVITLTTSCRTDDIITMQVGVNSIGTFEGVNATIRDGGESGKLIINLYADTQALVDTSDGSISYPPFGGAGNTGLLSDLSAVVESGVTKLTYDALRTIPTVQPFTGGLIDEFIPIRQTAGSTNNIWFKYETTPTIQKALVNFMRKPVDPTALLLSGLQLNIWCVLGDRSL